MLEARYRLTAVIVVVVSLLAGCSNAAYPRSFSSTGSLTPSLPDSSDETLPPFTVSPFDGAVFHWSPVNESDDWYMVGTFNFSNGQYLAIGLNSVKKMDGPMVICNVEGGASGFVVCWDFKGQPTYDPPVNYSTLPDDQQAATTFATKVGDVMIIQFKKLIFSPSRNISLMSMSGANRVIFARGKWGTALSPTQHQSDSAISVFMNFMTGEVVKPVSTSYRYVLYPALAAMVATSIVMRILISCYRIRFGDTARLVGVIAFCSAFTVVTLAYIVVYYSDFVTMVRPKAFFRAVGEGAVLVFSSMMLPMGRRFFFSDFFGISPERAVKFHIFGSALLIVVTTVHGGGMLYQYGADVFRWKEKDAVSRIPGIITYVLLIVQTVIGVLRHKIGFGRFRVAHYLNVLIFFFACCHTPQICYSIIPAIALFFFTNIYKRFFVRIGPNETIVKCVADQAAQVTILDIVKYDFTAPGSYYFIALPDIGVLAHPFSVYRCKQGKDLQVLRFIIRNTEKRKGFVGAANSTWTAKLFNRISGGMKLSTYRLDGPYGLLEHSPFNYQNYLLVAGGVGITSVASVLFKLAEADEKSLGRTDAKTNLWLLWVVSDPSWIHLLGEDLVNAKQTAKRTCCNLKVLIKVFVTNSRTLEAKHVKSVSQPITQNIQITYGKRPDWNEELKAFEEQQKKYSITSSDGTISTLNSAVMYCCGPEAMVSEATAAAKALKELVVDVNSSVHSF